MEAVAAGVMDGNTDTQFQRTQPFWASCSKWGSLPDSRAGRTTRLQRASMTNRSVFFIFHDVEDVEELGVARNDA